MCFAFIIFLFRSIKFNVTIFSPLPLLKRKYVVKMQTDPYLFGPETFHPPVIPPVNVKRLHAVTLFHFFTPSRSFSLWVSLNFLWFSFLLYSASRWIVRHARNEKLKNDRTGEEKTFFRTIFLHCNLSFNSINVSPYLCVKRLTREQRLLNILELIIY